MADHAEEQEMEAEALAAIFDTHFSIVTSSPHRTWSIDIYPESGDPSQLDHLNHVACRLLVTLPTGYPDDDLPILDVELLKGLAPDHRTLLKHLADEEAVANTGVPSIFAVAERLRDWLAENNIKGLDDVSMHAQMMRKQVDEKKLNAQNTLRFESQKRQEEMTDAEKEELAVQKRRAEGTPCNRENFLMWKLKFEAEMAAKAKAEETDQQTQLKKKGLASEKATERLTGYQYFSGKAVNLEALEAAAEAAGNIEEEEDVEEMNEELFDDDVDLDDIDFDDEDEGENEDLDI